MKSSVGVSARGPPRDPGSREAFGEHRKDSEGAATAPNGKEEAELGQTPQAVGLAGPRGTRAV